MESGLFTQMPDRLSSIAPADAAYIDEGAPITTVGKTVSGKTESLQGLMRSTCLFLGDNLIEALVSNAYLAVQIKTGIRIFLEMQIPVFYKIPIHSAK